MYPFLCCVHGYGLTVFMVDWGQLSAIPVESRIERLEDMAWPGEAADVYDGGPERAHGWLWPLPLSRVTKSTMRRSDRVL